MIAALFDTETTGLVKNSGLSLDKQPQVIEFYGCLLDCDTAAGKFEVIKELEFLANPGVPLPEIITKITGLTDADLKDAKPFPYYINGLQNFFEEAQMAAAHNLSFDKQLMNFEFARAKKEFIWPARMVCTVEATEHIKSHRLSLAKLYEHLFAGETFPGAHRAKADVEALKRCFIELLKQGMI